MNILIVGSGGREHALACKVAQSPDVTQIFVAPGNAGTHCEPKTENVAIDVLDFPKLIAFAQEKDIALTIVGPEIPLAAGIVDAFSAADLLCFGPTKIAAQLEASKAFSKAFMKKHNIPTAYYKAFSDANTAKQYIQETKTPVVLKADGLAGGKGVIIAHNETEAYAAIDTLLNEKRFGAACDQIIIEEYLTGQEVSFIVMCDGQHAIPLATAQDHKARDDGDSGPNTGGMGAYSPSPIINPKLQQDIMENIILPTVYGIAEAGQPYIGFLYAGLMITPESEAKVLEFNCRLGDPEAQVILPRLQTDLLLLCKAAMTQQLVNTDIAWDPRCALGVVLANKGYPYEYPSGDTIEGLENFDNSNSDIKLFHAGTKRDGDDIVAQSGRVLCLTALANTIEAAQQKAYEHIGNVHWNNIYYRNDIGHRAIT